VILHEKANRGLTLMEGFEHHAASASFAVVLLTADDEGRKVGEDELRPRGLQNVVLELGFSWAALAEDASSSCSTLALRLRRTSPVSCT
jgi:predicted nucleotide-binding protein